MSERLNDVEKLAVAAVESGLAAVARPYKAAAETVGLREGELIGALAALREKGALRRISAVLAARTFGLGSAALVAWRVEGERMDEVGAALAEKPFITHCISRKTEGDWPYNLYTMVHGVDADDVREKVSGAARELSLAEWGVFETLEELKKTPPKYGFLEKGQ
jgi:DNA-binding Lrp family transcriptional regulator